MKILIAALLLLVGSLAQAQTTRNTPCDPATPNNALCVMWGAVTTWTNGDPLTGAVTYRVERMQQTAIQSWLLVETTSGLRSYVRNLAPGNYTFRVIAIANAVESAPSNNGTGSVAFPPPSAPVIQVVSVVIGADHAPVFTVLKDGSRSTTVGGLAPVGVECETEVLFKYRGKNWHRPKSWKPWSTPSTARVAAPCA
jgi:hypothetical protein